MEAIMTVGDLVRDMCKTAAEIVERGDKITVKSGNKILFQIVPSEGGETQMTPDQYNAFVKTLETMADKTDLDENPIVRVRQETA